MMTITGECMKTFAFKSLILLIIGCFAATAQAAAPKQLTEDDVVAIVKRVIKEQPELIITSLQSMKEHEQASQMQKSKDAIKTNLPALTKNPMAPTGGNPNGDVTVIEFFDYHCGYCKRMLPVMKQLIDEDKKVKVVFKELPILSEDSRTAAQAAIAVNRIAPKKYFDYHTKLMAHNGSFTEENLASYAVDLGIDKSAFTKSFNDPKVATYLNEVMDLARVMDIQGTPAIIIGTQFFPGATDLASIKAAIAQQRSAK